MEYYSPRRIPWTLIGVAGLLFAATHTMDVYWSCWTPIRRRRIPCTLIGVAGLLFADDEYHVRLFELLDSYSPRRIPWTLIWVAGLLFAATHTMDAYWSCWTPIRRDEYHGRLLVLLDSYSPRRIPGTLIRVAGLLFADDEYHGRLLELLDSYSPRRIPWTLIGVAGLLFAATNTMDAHSSCWTLIPSHWRTPWRAVTSHLPFAELDWFILLFDINYIYSNRRTFHCAMVSAWYAPTPSSFPDLAIII
jgi:hypothetical protein